jgi:hypothetical protein
MPPSYLLRFDQLFHIGEKYKLYKSYNFAIKINRNNNEHDKSKKEGEVKGTGKSDRKVDTMRRKENKKNLDRRKRQSKEN